LKGRRKNIRINRHEVVIWKEENKNEDRKNKRKGITDEDTLVVVSW